MSAGIFLRSWNASNKGSAVLCSMHARFAGSATCLAQMLRLSLGGPYELWDAQRQSASIIRAQA